MTTLHVRALSRRAGALLGAVAVLAAGCAAAGGNSGPRAARAGTAQDAGAASASSLRFARPTGPGSVKHSSGAPIRSPTPLFQCEHPMGHPVAGPVSAASRSRLVISACPCCGWCSCAWACCGCGPGRWPPGWGPRSHLAWLCCARWHWPPSAGAALIPPACEPGCRSFACPAGPRILVPGPGGATAGSVQERSPGGGSQRPPISGRARA
jgi:hypothetical protein